jgi:TetR/AcrR family transcriptional regulator, regulator of biofilm formation and stress response
MSDSENSSLPPGRQALINAAIAVVAEKGLRGLTYRAVAEKAGVTHALVTHYFGSRDTFILEALQSTVLEAENGFFKNDRSLDGFASHLSDFVAEKSDLLIFQYELMLESLRRPELVEPIRRMYRDVEKSTGEELSKLNVGGEDRGLVRLVVATLDGLFLRNLVDGDAERTQESVEILRELLTMRRDLLVRARN